MASGTRSLGGNGQAHTLPASRRVCLALLIHLCSCGALLAFAGCHMAGSGYRPSPISSTQQRQEIEKLAPIGTSRSEVERRLKDAGIEVTPGVSERIAYCDLWNRTGGERWVLNVALLFDEAGNLSETRPAQSETGIFTGNLPHEESVSQVSAEVQETEPLRQTTQGSPKETNFTENRSLSNQDRRTPFETPKPAYAP